MQLDLERLSLEELLELNRQVVNRITRLQELKTRANLDRFEVGDNVSFQAEDRLMEGVVVRVNNKSLSVKTQNTFWRIHPRFVTRLPEPKAGLPGFVDNMLNRLKGKD